MFRPKRYCSQRLVRNLGLTMRPLRQTMKRRDGALAIFPFETLNPFFLKEGAHHVHDLTVMTSLSPGPVKVA